jgi:hypothetical protein
MFHLMLKPSWQGGFGRTVTVNNITQRMTFAPETPVSVSAEELEQLRNDIGRALCVAKFDEKHRPKPDWDKTQRLMDGDSADDVFADEPPVVVNEDQSPGLPIEESLIPEKHHAALKSVELHTLEAIDEYISGGGKLTDIHGIGDAIAAEITEAMEAHAEPKADA